MRRFIYLFALCVFNQITLSAQKPFKGKFYNEENRINLVINLYEENIEVPSMEMFGPMHGYLNGNVYGIWSITSSKIENDNTATIRLSNELGSETQQVKLTLNNDSTILFEQEEELVIKKVVKKKLVKIPQSFIMKKISNLK